MSIDGGDPLGDVIADLRRELGRIAEAVPVPGGETDPGIDVALRRMSDASGVTADHPPLVRAGRLAPARRAVKGAIQRSLRWYVERLALDVRRFAQSSTDAAVLLSGRLARLEARQDQLAALHGAPPAARGVPGFDYARFEALMRGSAEEIGQRQRQYLPVFAESDDIVDLGCGRGEFLSLLREAGKRGRGVDADPRMVALCQADGLEAEEGDAVAHLAGLRAASIGGVFSAQLVEHLQSERLVVLLTAARSALRPGGLMVLETINPVSLSALRHYFADPTHVQPLVPQTLAFLTEAAGFREVSVRFTSAVPDAARLARVPLGASVPDEARAALDRDVDLLNELLFAPQDYAVIARA